MIPQKECKNRKLYRIRSRNLSFGVYNEETGGFLGLREKFGDVYVFEEYHWDTGAPHGTVSPKEELPETLPDNIPLAESIGTVCANCSKKVEYAPWPGGDKEITLSDGSKMTTGGRWVHLEETPCQKIMGAAKENKPLYDWLVEMEKKYLHLLEKETP